MKQKDNLASGTTIWNRSYLLLLCINCIIFITLQMHVPIFPVFALKFTTAESVLGLLSSSIAFASIAIRPIAGLLSDTGNKRSILFLSLVVLAIIHVGYIFVNVIWILFLLRIIHGLLFAIITTVVVTSAIKAIPPDKIGQGVGIIGVTTTGGQAIGPMLGASISVRWGFNILFALITILIIIAVFIVPKIESLKEDSPQVPAVERRTVNLKQLVALEAIDLFFVTFLFSVAAAVINNFLLLYSVNISIDRAEYYFTIYAVVVVLVRVLGSKLLDRIPYGKIACLSVVAGIISLLLIANASSFLYFAIAAVLMGISFGFVMPALQVAMINRVTPDRFGAANATFMLGCDVSLATGPALMGIMVEGFSFSIGFLFFIPFFVAIVPIILFCRKR